MRGRSDANEGTICEGSRPMAAHVGTFIKATPLSLETQHELMAQDSWVRLLMSALCFITTVPLA